MKYTLVRLASRGRKIAAWSSCGVTRRLGTQDKKHFRLGDYKFSFDRCSPSYRAPVLLTFLRCIVQADAGIWRAGCGEPGDFL